MKPLTLPFLFLLSASYANAKDIALDDCPQPVRETIQSHMRGGTIDEIESHGIDGKTLYVAEIDLADRRDLKLHVSADGTLLKSREDVATGDLPEAVRKAAEAKAAGGRIDDVDKETVDGTVTFHVEIDRPGLRDLEVAFAADGKIVSETDDRD